MRVGWHQHSRPMVSIKIPTPRNYQRGIQVFAAAAHQLCDGRAIDRAIVAVPGILDNDRRIMTGSPHLRTWIGRSIARDLESALHTRVQLENDADLAAVGEAIYGAGRSFRVVGYIAIGTGIGGALVVDKKLVRGRTTFEPGHMLVEPNKDWESCLGGKQLQRRFGSEWKRWTRTNWNWAEQKLAIGLVNVVNMWSPDIIVVSGSVGQHKHLRLNVVQHSVRRQLQTIRTCPPIRRGTLHDLAGLRGARVI